jgi:tRNA-modifying protein YgfZ
MSFDDQYAAAHDSAVLGERADLATVIVTGVDRRAFLHALFTNDIASLAPGEGTYAAYLTPQGRMISDLRAVETGDRILLGVERRVAAALAERLDKLVFSEDVQVRDASDELVGLGVYGPEAHQFVERALAIPASTLTREYSTLTTPFTVIRDETFGVPGFEMWLDPGEHGRIRGSLIEAGAVPAGGDIFETLRIEAGRPRFGLDMSTDTIPLEAGIEDRAIDFTKGCYVGQEVIIRVMHRGHGRVARRLVRLVLPAGTSLKAGDPILDGERRVGEITSAANSPRARGVLAFGYVQRDYADTPKDLEVAGSKAVLYQPAD